MRPSLITSYPNYADTGAPRYVGVDDAAGVAISVRQQLGLEDGNCLAVDLDLLTAIEQVTVNGVTYHFEWHVGGPVTNEANQPVLGVCEHDPAIPDAALICVNPDPVAGREEILLSTAAHELGHGLFEVPKWIIATQHATLPTLFKADKPAHTRVHRLVTPDETHLSVTPPHGSPAFFEEVRANAFMGALLAPIHRVYARLEYHCRNLGLSLGDLQQSASAAVEAPVATQASEIYWTMQRRHLHQKIDLLLTRLARDFGVSKRFMEVRVKRYGFLGQANAAA